MSGLGIVGAAGVDTGDTAWMLVATALVLLMTPALGLFYAGLVRSKNTLNTFMMCIAAIAVVHETLAQEITDGRNGSTETTRWRYDGSRLLEVDHPSGRERYEYDQRGLRSAPADSTWIPSGNWNSAAYSSSDAASPATAASAVYRPTIAWLPGVTSPASSIRSRTFAPDSRTRSKPRRRWPTPVSFRRATPSSKQSLPGNGTGGEGTASP